MRGIMNRPVKVYIFLVLLFILIANCPAQEREQAPPCVKDPSEDGYKLISRKPITGLARNQFYPSAIAGPDENGEGLILDLKDDALEGIIYSGIFYFDRELPDYFAPVYRKKGKVKNGRAVIPIKSYLINNSMINANRWTDEGVLAYRLHLWKQKNSRLRHLGFYDSVVRFRYRNGRFSKALTLTEGPSVNLINSVHPEWMVIAFETDSPSRAGVEVPGLGFFSDDAVQIHHEIRVEGLKPRQNYRYRVIASAGPDTLRSPYFSFKTAPQPGAWPVVFAYTGDSRAGYGGGEYSYLGTNSATLRQTAIGITQHRAEFLLFNGDLVSGYADDPEDILLQFKAFKQSVFGYSAYHPLYVGVGNHDVLVRRWDDGSQYGLGMDNWPYSTASVEAVIAQQFVNPTNAPVPVEGRPPFAENTYSFLYGNVLIIVFNNDYWWTTHRHIPTYGGSPEGYLLPEQMNWIREEIKRGESSPRVDHILLMAHKQAFPNGYHQKDGMWYYGNNHIRAYSRNKQGKVRPMEKGIIEVRNEFWEMVSNASKVVAVLSSDEHSYHRTLITNQTPVGIFPEDDLNGNGKLDDDQFSANPNFRQPVWSLVGGGAGAPYYVQKNMPWSDWVYSHSIHTNYLIFTATDSTLGLEVYSLTGKLLDKVPDLTDVKRNPVKPPAKSLRLKTNVSEKERKSRK